jgi:hypothetical protein
MSGQFRVFQNKLTGAATDDKAYGLDSAILDLTAKIRSDFVKPKPSTTLHSNVVPVMEADGRTPTGENRLVCHDPALKEQIDAEYNMNLKSNLPIGTNILVIKMDVSERLLEMLSSKCLPTFNKIKGWHPLKKTRI